MCVHHTKNYRHGLLRLEFEAHGSIFGWIGKCGSDEGGNRLDQEGQQKHLSKEKLRRLVRRRQYERARGTGLTREQEALILLAIAPCKK